MKHALGHGTEQRGRNALAADIANHGGEATGQGDDIVEIAADAGTGNGAGAEPDVGEFGKMLRDEQLYEQLTKTITDLNAILADVRQNPRKYTKGMIKVF